jgi:glutamate transport system substrate-binding protein
MDQAQSFAKLLHTAPFSKPPETATMYPSIHRVTHFLACIALACTATATTLAVAAAPVFPPDSTMAKIQKRGDITIGVHYDVPLFDQKNPLTGKLQGYEIDIANQLGRDLFGSDGHVKFIEAPGPVREQFILQHKADLILATYTITAARLKTVAFAGPIYEAKQAIVVKTDNKAFGKTIPDFAALNDHSVCVVSGSISNVLLLKVAPKAKIMALGNNPDCAKAVRQGRVEAFATDDALLIGFVNETPKEIRFVDNAGGDEQPYGVGVNKDSLDLCRWVNERLLDMSKDGFLDKSFGATVGTVIKRKPEPLKATDMKYCE